MVDLQQYDTPTLKKLLVDIDKELNFRKREKARQARQELRRVAAKYGFTLDELLAGKMTRSSGEADAQYAHPSDPSKTWSGRGRRPLWLKELEESGYSLEQLRIKE